MFSINTNNNALAALQSLNSTASMLANAQNAVSTGQKVSSAEDNPAVYSISQTMNANIAGLSAVSDSLNLGSSVLKVATQAAASISSNLASLQQTATTAQTTGLDPVTMQNQIDATVKQINEFANTATFNGVNLLATTGTTGVSNTNLNIVQDVNGGTLAVTNSLTAGNLNLAMQLGLSSGTSVASNLQVSASAVQFSAVSATAPASNDFVKLSNGTTSDTFEFIVGTAAMLQTASSTNTLHQVLITGTESLSGKLSALASAMNTAGYSAALDSSGNLDVMGKGVTSAASSESVTGSLANSSINGTTAAVAVVQAAVTKMNTISAALGSQQQQVSGMAAFTSSLSSALTSGVGALTDADLAAESAKLTSLQTKQSLAIQSLSIANAQPQALLTLFR